MVKAVGFFETVQAQCRARRVMSRSGDCILEVEFPAGGKLRSRTIVSRSRARPTGKYPSLKMGRMMQWESHNELNAFRLLDATPAAVAFHEQPLAVRFQLHGSVHTHFPDVLVQWRDSRELWEIKPKEEALDPLISERTKFLAATLPTLGFQYRMVLSDELRAQPRLNNVLTLLRFGREPVADDQRERVRRLLCEVPSISWSAAIQGALGPKGVSSLCRLVLEGVLHVDLEAGELMHAGSFCLAPSESVGA